MYDGKAQPSGRYAAEVVLIDKLGWTWQDVRDAPNDLIEELFANWAARDRWTTKRQEVNQAKARSKTKANHR